MSSALVLGLTLACSPLLGMLSTPTPAATLTPTPLPTATATPTPTATPEPEVALEEGHRALRYGDWDAASLHFQEVLGASSDPAARSGAELGLARTLLESGRVWEAEAALTTFLETYPDSEQSADAHFLRAEARVAMGSHDLAAEDYGRYRELRPERIEAYVAEWQGDALGSAGRPLEAIQRYQEAAAAPRLQDVIGLQIKIGRAYMNAGDYDSALNQFNLVQQVAGDDATRASMNLLAGQALEAMGDEAGALARYRDSVESYPAAYDTYVGLISLVEAGVAVDDFLRGYIDYYAGAYEPALDAFDRHLNASPTAAGYYYRGLTRRALGFYPGALADFTTVVEGYPSDSLAPDAWFEKARTEWAYLDMFSVAAQTYLSYVSRFPSNSDAPDALFLAGRSAERVHDLAEAAAIWLRLPSEYPSTEAAFRGAFQAGIARYRLGDFTGANEAFLLAQAHGAEPGDLAASYLWIGKCLEAAGDTSGAEQAWKAAAEADPTGYYSVRAEELLAGKTPFTPASTYSLAPDLAAEEQQAEAWLKATFVVDGPEPLSELDPVLLADPRWARAEELFRLGKESEAEAEWTALQQAYFDDAEATYRLMHQFLALRQYRLGILASRQILRLAGMDDAATMSGPVFFNRVRFGLYFTDLVLPEAESYGLDGLFLLSILRQESLFDITSTSSAQALGLMQVIPSTGEGIAAQLGWPPDYQEEDLYRPLVSVRFGTYYLSSQLRHFEGDPYAALAAYNGGPGNADAWKELAPDDLDLYLEVIRIQETHLYIRRISEIYAIYRRLYAGPP